MRLLLALIIVVPALEIGFFILSGKTIGVWPTVLLIILTGVLGAWLAKKQGLETLSRAKEQMSYGNPPGDAILDGICILAGGIFLLSPGFLSDFFGLLLLIPQTRQFFKPLVIKLIQRLINRGNFIYIRR